MSGKRKIGQGTYGNRQSGKVYSYYVPENARAGQKFRVEAYNKRARRVIQTMWTLTTDPVVEKGGSGFGEQTVARQKERTDAETGQVGVGLRTALDTDTLALPGGERYGQIALDRGLTDSQAKALWALNSNINDLQSRGLGSAAQGRIKARDILLGLNPRQDNTAAASRILGGDDGV